MGLSLVALIAAAGLLTPVTGAALQEAIDVTASWSPCAPSGRAWSTRMRMSDADLAAFRRLWIDHQSTHSLIEQIGTVADALSGDPVDLSGVRSVADRLTQELVPHERADEEQPVPIAARALGEPNTTAGLSRTHAEIAERVGRLRRLLDVLTRASPCRTTSSTSAGCSTACTRCSGCTTPRRASGSSASAQLWTATSGPTIQPSGREVDQRPTCPSLVTPERELGRAGQVLEEGRVEGALGGRLAALAERRGARAVGVRRNPRDL